MTRHNGRQRWWVDTVSGAAPSRLVIGLTMAALICIWGTTWGAILISLKGFAPLTAASIRFAIAAAILWGVARARRIELGGVENFWLWWVQATFAFSLSYGIVYWAEQWVPSGLTSVLFSTLPLFVMIFAYGLLPEERPSLGGLLGLMGGFAGVVLIFSDDVGALADPLARRAALILLLSPIGAALAQVVVKRWGSGLNAFSLTAPPLAMTALFLGTLAWLFERDRSIVLDPAPVLATLYLAVVGTAVTFILFFWLLRHVLATQLSLIAYAIPVVAVFIGTVYFDEPLTLRMVAGSALVIIGVGFAARPRVARGSS